MKRLFSTLVCAVFFLLSAAPLWSHELVGVNGQVISTHQHVWRQQEYGSDYRQGHSVNNAQGSITIWSPNTYQGYNAGSAVRFARPELHTQRSKVQDHKPNIKSTSPNVYGKSRVRDNG
jgi:hypothetical protein